MGSQSWANLLEYLFPQQHTGIVLVKLKEEGSVGANLTWSNRFEPLMTSSKTSDGFEPVKNCSSSHVVGSPFFKNNPTYLSLPNMHLISFPQIQQLAPLVRQRKYILRTQSISTGTSENMRGNPQSVSVLGGDDTCPVQWAVVPPAAPPKPSSDKQKHLQVLNQTLDFH